MKRIFKFLIVLTVLVTLGTVLRASLPQVLSGTWVPVSPMNSARSGASSSLLEDGRVLVSGGTTSGGGITNSAEIYNATTNTWTDVTGGMIEARAGHTATVLSDGRVFIAGGSGSGGTISSSVEIFDP